MLFAGRTLAVFRNRNQPDHAVIVFRGNRNHRGRHRIFRVARTAALTKNRAAVSGRCARSDHCQRLLVAQERQQLRLKLAIRVAGLSGRPGTDRRHGSGRALREIGVAEPARQRFKTQSKLARLALEDDFSLQLSFIRLQIFLCG